MTTETRKHKMLSKLKTLGIAGFLFFFFKGMAWLALGYFVLK